MDLTLTIETWPVAGVFRIARREATTTDVLVITLSEGHATGRGECGPIARYGETVESCKEQINALRRDIEAGMDPHLLQQMLPPGAARNALDCALWDLRAKQVNVPVWQLAGLEEPQPVTTAFTISVDTPEKVLDAVDVAAHLPLLKIKLAGDEHDLTRVRVARAAAQQSRLIIDANEAFTVEGLAELLPTLISLQVEMIEQPLPAGDDDALERLRSPIPICADESCHLDEDLNVLAARYDAINIKLDKTGGLTAALDLKSRAEAAELKVMVGCMLGTSLAMAPAHLLAQGADWVDIDGPLLLAEDREPGMVYRHGIVLPPDRELWG